MKFPYPKHLDITPIKVTVTSGISEEGEPLQEEIYNGKCRLVSGAKYIRDADGKQVRIESVVYIGGDIAPSHSTFTGSVCINGLERKIYRVNRPLNPDGTVNHTKLELI